MNMSNGLQKLCVVLAAGLAWTGAAFAQANSIDAFDVAQQGGNIVVRITTKEPLKSAPPSFTVANPARIVFDFPGTCNALGRNSQDVGQGELRSMNLVQGADRTRMVLNLRRSVAHERGTRRKEHRGHAVGGHRADQRRRRPGVQLRRGQG